MGPDCLIVYVMEAQRERNDLCNTEMEGQTTPPEARGEGEWTGDATETKLPVTDGRQMDPPRNVTDQCKFKVRLKKCTFHNRYIPLSSF